MSGSILTYANYNRSVSETAQVIGLQCNQVFNVLASGATQSISFVPHYLVDGYATAEVVYDITLSASCILTFVPGTAVGIFQRLTLILRQPASGSTFTATLPSNVNYPGGSPPAVSTAAGAATVITFMTPDNGATVFAAEGVSTANQASQAAQATLVNQRLSGFSNRCDLSQSALSPGGHNLLTYRKWMYALRSANAVRLVYSNVQVLADAEHFGQAPYYVKASVEAGGVSWPVTFGGSREVLVAPGATVGSDRLDMAIPAGGYFVRTRVRTTAGTAVPVYINNMLGTQGEALGLDIDAVDRTGSAGMTVGYAGGVFGPSAMLGLVGAGVPLLQVGIIGSSSPEGYLDVAEAPFFDYGYLARALSAGGVPYYNTTKGGDTLAAFLASSAARINQVSAADATHLIMLMGANDITNGTSYAGMQSLLFQAWNIAATYGQQLIAPTFTPRSNSSDNWKTLSGQSAGAGDNVRQQINAWIRTRPHPAIADVWDIAPIGQDPNNAYAWKTDGSTANLWTADGTHCSVYGYEQIALALASKVAALPALSQPSTPIASLPALAVTGITPLVAGGTSTVSLSFSGGAPAVPTATVDGSAVTVSGFTTSITSGMGAFATGTATFTISTPAAAAHALIVSSTGTYAASTASYSFTTTASGAAASTTPATFPSLGNKVVMRLSALTTGGSTISAAPAIDSLNDVSGASGAGYSFAFSGTSGGKATLAATGAPNGRPAFVFPATSSVFSDYSALPAQLVSQLTGAGQPIHIFSFVEASSVPDNVVGTILQVENANSGSYVNHIAHGIGGGSGNCGILAIRGDANGTGSVTSNGTSNYGSWNLTEETYDGSQISVAISSPTLQTAPNPSGANGAITGVTAVRIGARTSSGTKARQFAGSMAEVVVCNAILTTAERASLVAWINSTYGQSFA